MDMSSCYLETKAEKGWPYDEYYFGKKDKEERRAGKGENHWTGAEVAAYFILLLEILDFVNVYSAYLGDNST